MAHVICPQGACRPVPKCSPVAPLKARASRHVAARSAAAETASAEASTSTDVRTLLRELPSIGTWYACVANAAFFLNDTQNESFAEQLREKARHYKDNNKELDFFLVCEPEWLDQQHPQLKGKVGRPCVALVGKDKSWITYMKLRLDRVLQLEVKGTKAEVTKCGAPVPEFERLDKQKGWVAPYPPYAPGWWNVFMPGRVDA